MIEKICENLFIEVIDEHERFSIIGSPEDLYYDTDKKQEDFIFKTQNYYMNNLPFGQRTFSFKLYSIQEYFDVLGYLSYKGYLKRIGTNISNTLEYCGNRLERKLWSLEEIRENPKEIYDFIMRWNNLQGYMYLEVVIDRKRLEKFKEDIKSMPGYKFTWLYVDKTNKEINDYIVK